MNNPDSVDININITLTIDTKNGKSSPVVKTWIDDSQKLSTEELTELQQKNQSRVDTWVELNKSNVDTKGKESIVKKLLKQIDQDRRHYLITWTYGRKNMGHDDSEVEDDIKNIRYRIIKMFYQNFKGKDRMRPDDDFPRMYFFKERHQDGQYHIHLLIESIEPDLLAQSFDKESFLLRYYTIRQKIINRKDLIITKKMIERWEEYQHHELVNRTYDSICEYDDWMVSRFICEYITHYGENQRWGLSKLSNSPDNNHSKVIESKLELKNKIDYLNKDQYFMTNTSEYLGHLVPQYSDYHL